MQNRIRKVIRALSLIVLSGMGYLIVWTKLHISIPCIFYEITGFYCPGCGVSRMCLFLSRAEFYKAFWSNPLVFVLTPVLFFEICRETVHYIRGSRPKKTKAETCFWIGILIIVLLYGIVRNLPQFAVLAPNG